MKPLHITFRFFEETHILRTMRNVAIANIKFNEIAASFKTPLNQGNVPFTFGIVAMVVLVSFLLSKFNKGVQ